MKNTPLPVLFVALMFFTTGCVGIAYHFKEFFEPDAKLSESIWVLFVRVLAIVCAIFLLLRMDWARWLAITWLLYHIVIGALHSSSQLIAHIVFLLIVSVLLYLPVSSAYFRTRRLKLNSN